MWPCGGNYRLGLYIGPGSERGKLAASAQLMDQTGLGTHAAPPGNTWSDILTLLVTQIQTLDWLHHLLIEIDSDDKLCILITNRISIYTLCDHMGPHLQLRHRYDWKTISTQLRIS